VISASGTMLIELRETQQRPLDSMKGPITKKELKERKRIITSSTQNKIKQVKQQQRKGMKSALFGRLGKETRKRLCEYRSSALRSRG